jgi:glycosyltransferase involved in cell wall biosynthesis
MKGAVALIVPSIAFEVFPTVTLEAFAQGTPAILRDIGSLPEQIEQSGGGFLYRTNAELAGAMDRLLASPALCDDLGRRGREAYEARWTPGVHIHRYLDLIGDLTARHDRTRNGSDRGAAGR